MAPKLFEFFTKTIIFEVSILILMDNGPEAGLYVFPVTCIFVSILILMDNGPEGVTASKANYFSKIRRYQTC